MKLSVVIPAHNEEGSLKNTVDEVIAVLHRERIPCEIICVNDNSIDATERVIVDLAKTYPEVKLINRKPPSGFGRAIKDGINSATGDAVVFVMADLSDEPEDIVRYYRKLQEGYDCVFGSRFIRGSRVTEYPRLKLFLNRLANNMVRALFLTKYNDITNAFKMYRREALQQCLPLVSMHFNISAEIPLKAINRGFKAAQIPINWYGRKSGISKLKIRQITRKYFFTIFYTWLEKILLTDEIRKGRRVNKNA